MDLENKDLKDDLIMDDTDNSSVSSVKSRNEQLMVPAVPLKLNTLKVANIPIKGLDQNARSRIKLRK